ncbi:Gfo/Idh/MocA family protein [Phytoactinopolyspora halotolerans]|uniref:Gfo/Idh/MocA family oxidoreductase n=1 Tax=Phytoactinopolyspora halotolerans TaxID=1981512 RepID=A0A6L9SEI6_9ACTN|nr:Gfo/Idh/MocA family oxidoreductase [Phytoactinopolyspora halotolerans]NEE03517.1 Gfo/Idh/MocA family oxidoreductase [Phytoactinopolyspora halotolerans]
MTDDSTPTLGIGMVGYAFMGIAHSHASRNAASFFDLPAVPRLAVVAGRNADAARDTAEKFGWHDVETDWRALVERDDVDLVDVCTPGDTHAEIATAALRAGKHVLCEKPLANSVPEAEAMAQAAEAARARGARSMVGFTYRRVPAIALARTMVADGRIGEIRHVRAQYLQDWLVDPAAPMSWRLERDRAGSGALGDIGAHIIDLTQFITGESIVGVSAMTETFIDRRPIADAGGASKLGGHASGDDLPTGEVSVDDAALFLSRFSGGALAIFEATRYATGRKNAIRIEINGSAGALAFDFEEMNTLHFYDGTGAAAMEGFRRILVTEPDHPYLAAWWPPGHLLGYEHGFTHQAVDLIKAIAGGDDPEPSFVDGLRVQRVLAAVEQSAAKDSAWTTVGN